MANRKISQLDPAGTLTGTEAVEIVQGGANVQTTTQDIADLGGGGGASDWGDLGGTLSDQTDLQAALDDKLDAIATIVSGGTNYTLQASDLALITAGANVIIEGDGTGTLTIPVDATVDFPDNVLIGFRGFILVAVAGGVTETHTNDSLDCDPGLEFTWILEKRATNTWNISNGTSGTGGGGGGGTWGSITGTLSSQTDLQGELDSKSDAIATIVSGGTNYTLQASDLALINSGANIIIEGDGTGTLTIPLNSSVAFPLNCFIGFRGFILVAATVGVSATPTNASLDCDPDFLFALEKTATNTWNVHNGAEDTGGGGGGGGTWGSITGTLSDQTDLNTALGLKAALASPALTGTPTAPTASLGTSTTQIATTAYVQQQPIAVATKLFLYNNYI